MSVVREHWLAGFIGGVKRGWEAAFLLYVILDLLCVRTTVDKDFFHACIRQELECVFDERYIC